MDGFQSYVYGDRILNCTKLEDAIAALPSAQQKKGEKLAYLYFSKQSSTDLAAPTPPFLRAFPNSLASRTKQSDPKANVICSKEYKISSN